MSVNARPHLEGGSIDLAEPVLGEGCGLYVKEGNAQKWKDRGYRP